MRMILIQVILVLISVPPFAIYITYVYITTGITKDSDQLMVENFLAIFFSIISYFYSAVC
jgi:hypothetical protein